LVAEIFSRYYDKDIHMHSFDNGQSVKIRKDNWKLLLKVFRRVRPRPLVHTHMHTSIIQYWSITLT
jgi:hypothetical protein